MFKLIFAFTLLIALPTQTRANMFYDGNRLYEICTAPEEKHASWGVCLGFILGAHDAVRDAQELGFLAGKIHCTPTNATTGQVRDVVVRYLEEHPAERHINASALVADALREAFPCP
jgi:hypothetical protein